MDQSPWAAMDDDALLNTRIRNLGLSVTGTTLEPMVIQFYSEISARGLVFHPPCHVGDEWFVPVDIPAIFVPFFLVHDRLRELERRMVLDVEGETPEAFMKLLRHEAGHAFAYAYGLHRKRKWRQIFGRSSAEDTPFYRPRPYSRSFVLHLDDWYAQAHPDEDFAETFAVWLTPGLDWRARYKGWRALAKLEYVDGLMQTIAGKLPPFLPEFKPANYDCLGVKLKTYYARKRKLYADSYPDFYDKDLRTLFPLAMAGGAQLSAVVYLKRHRRSIVEAVCDWTNEKKYRVDNLLQRLTDRCAKLELAVAETDSAAPLRIASYVTTLVMNHLFTGKFKRTK